MENINKEKIYKILSIILLFAMFSVFCKYANSQSFWLDELDWTIDYLAKSHNLIELFQALIKTGFNLPLYYVMMFPIYKIVPFGELWLLIPNFIAIIGGIYIINKIGNKVGENLGFASLCISATSYTLMKYCAFEFRPYAFLFCFSAYTLYRYICRLQEPKKRSNIILYALSMILLAYTHWFGCLIIVFYFLVDVILLLRKKNTISFILSYIVLGIIFLPYFIIMMLNHTTNFTKYWPCVPTTKELFTTFAFLLNENFICILLFITGIVILLLYVLKKSKNSNIDTNVIFILFGCIIWTLVTIFLYSKFINPNGSLWVSRYFIVILPHIFIITSIPIARLLCISNTIPIKNKKNIEISIKRLLILYVIVFIIAIIVCINYQKLRISENGLYEPYREISELIANTPNVYEENSAVLMSSGKGYITYYFEKKGINKLPYNVFEAYTESSLTQNNMTKCVSEGKTVNSIDASLEDLLKYDKIYLCQVHKNFENEIKEFISKNYNVYIVNQTLRVYLCEKK